MDDSSTVPALLTGRFELRPLTPDDATPRYLDWLVEKDARRFILAAQQASTLDDLRTYIASRCNRSDVLFLGIFERASGIHVGNIKYEPIDENSGTAEMGILIGDPSWRGRGVAGEVVAASAKWLLKQRGIRKILLGVEADNPGATTAYLRAGFKPIGTIRDPRATCEIVRMQLDIDNRPA